MSELPPFVSFCPLSMSRNELRLSIYYGYEMAHWTGWKSEVDKKNRLCVHL